MRTETIKKGNELIAQKEVIQDLVNRMKSGNGIYYKNGDTYKDGETEISRVTIVRRAVLAHSNTTTINLTAKSNAINGFILTETEEAEINFVMKSANDLTTNILDKALARMNKELEELTD